MDQASIAEDKPARTRTTYRVLTDLACPLCDALIDEWALAHDWRKVGMSYGINRNWTGWVFHGWRRRRRVSISITLIVHPQHRDRGTVQLSPILRTTSSQWQPRGEEPTPQVVQDIISRVLRAHGVLWEE